MAAANQRRQSCPDDERGATMKTQQPVLDESSTHDRLLRSLDHIEEQIGAFRDALKLHETLRDTLDRLQIPDEIALCKNLVSLLPQESELLNTALPSQRRPNSSAVNKGPRYSTAEHPP